MLALTKKTGYGLIALTHLAELPGGQVASAREMADRFDIPASLLMNVLKELSSAGYIESVRGAHGGYRLGRAPEEISLADLVTVVEGPIRLASCLAEEGKLSDRESCLTVADCPVADPVHRVQRRLSDFLKTLTLAEMMAPASGSSKE
ncbi:hypothetical protein LCGC14_2589370 [marine sediment metagenome]|uniref:Rrf2 family transcriptional regulator n=1 Tax=marine sediment metagenome TaxID=412755 RepID=A0A0F9D4U0_9ZZZZ